MKKALFLLFVVFASYFALASTGSAANLAGYNCDGKDILATECDALVDFYVSLNGSGANGGSGWIGTAVNGGWNSALNSGLVDNTMCDWKGVTCSGPHVTKLYLLPQATNPGYSGTIPESLTGLSYLEEFGVLGTSQVNIGTVILPLYSSWGAAFPNMKRFTSQRGLFTLSGSLSNTISRGQNWTNLEFFSLAQAGTSTTNTGVGYIGTLPAARSGWTQLRGFSLIANFSGSLPTEWGSWSALDVFKLHNPAPWAVSPTMNTSFPSSWSAWNMDTDAFVSSLYSSSSVVGNGFVINYGLLSGTLPSSWSSWIGLREFLINSSSLTCDIQGSLPSSWSSWTKISTFLVNKCKIGGALPSSWSAWTGIQSFKLINTTNILTSLPSSWSSWTNINTFYISAGSVVGSFLGESLPASWSSWTKISDFSFISSNLGGTLPASYSGWFQTGTTNKFAINNNKLIGNLPSEYGNWKNVSEFRAYFNELTGNFPSSWLGGFGGLTVFAINNNQLSGVAEDAIGTTWTGLVTFTINNNQFTGALPTAWCGLTKLTNFQVQFNNFNGTLPDCFSNMTGITTFYVNNNKLIGELPSSYSAWTKITDFNASSNQLTGALPSSYSAWTKIAAFSVNNNQLTGSLPSSWSTWTGITAFNVSNNQLVGSLPMSYDAWTKVSSFSVNSNQFTGVLPSWTTIGTLSTIDGNSIMNFSNNKFVSPLPDSWASLKPYKLDLSNNRFDGTLPSAWGSMAMRNASAAAKPVLNISNNFIRQSIPTSWTTLLSLMTGATASTPFTITNNCLDTVQPEPPSSTVDAKAGIAWKTSQKRCFADNAISSTVASANYALEGQDLAIQYNWSTSGLYYNNAAYIDIILPDVFDLQSANYSYSPLGGDMYRFDLGVVGTGMTGNLIMSGHIASLSNRANLVVTGTIVQLYSDIYSGYVDTVTGNNTRLLTIPVWINYKPTVTYPLDSSFITGSSLVSFVGTGYPGDTINIVTSTGGMLCQVVVNGSGDWICPNRLFSPDDLYHVAIYSSLNGNTGDSVDLSFTIDTILATGNVLDMPLVTNKTFPDLHGMVSETTASIYVVLDGETYTASNNGDGTRTLPGGSYSLSGKLYDLTGGIYDIDVRVVDEHGNTFVQTYTNTLTIDTGVPVGSIDTVVVNSSSPELTGSVNDINAIVLVEVNGAIYTATNNGDGTWSLASNIMPSLGEGSHVISVQFLDSAGNSSTASQSVVVDTIAPSFTVVTPYSSLLTNDIVGFSGTGEVGSTVVVTVSGMTLSGVVNSSGEWGSLWFGPLADSSYIANLYAIDMINIFNYSDIHFSIDTQDPIVPELISPTNLGTGHSGIITSTGVTLVFSGEAGALFTIQVNGSILTGYFDANGLGTGLIDLSSFSSPGSYSFEVFSTDTSSNTSSLITLPFYYDTDAPVAPTINNPSPGDSLVPGVSRTITGSTSSSDSGSIVTLLIYDDGGLLVGTYTGVVDSLGYFDIDYIVPQLAGDYSFHIALTDLAGQQGAETVIDVQVAKPPMPTITSPSSGASMTLTNGGGVSFSGNAGTGENMSGGIVTITITGANGFSQTLTGSIDIDGNFVPNPTIVIPNIAGDYTISTIVTDRYGNISAPTERNITVPVPQPSPITKSNGGPTSQLSKDSCPNGDHSSSYYDGDCGVQVSTDRNTHASAPESSISQKQLLTVSTLSQAYLLACGDIYNPTLFSSLSSSQQNKALVQCFAYPNKLSPSEKLTPFKPGASLNRAEFAQMISLFWKNVLEFQIPEITNQSCNFSDIDSLSSGLQQSISDACAAGLMYGYAINDTGTNTNKPFGPFDDLTYGQFATVVVKSIVGYRKPQGFETYYMPYIRYINRYSKQYLDGKKITPDMYDTKISRIDAVRLLHAIAMQYKNSK